MVPTGSFAARIVEPVSAGGEVTIKLSLAEGFSHSGRWFLHYRSSMGALKVLERRGHLPAGATVAEFAGDVLGYIARPPSAVLNATTTRDSAK
jgi:hypothetical protein